MFYRKHKVLNRIAHASPASGFQNVQCNTVYAEVLYSHISYLAVLWVSKTIISILSTLYNWVFEKAHFLIELHSQWKSRFSIGSSSWPPFISKFECKQCQEIHFFSCHHWRTGQTWLEQYMKDENLPFRDIWKIQLMQKRTATLLTNAS